MNDADKPNIPPWPNASYDTVKPMLFKLFAVLDRELIKLYVDRAYTEWYNQKTK